MITPAIKVGDLVINPKAPHWGPGKVLAVVGKSITVYWRDLREAKPGDAIKTINIAVVPLEPAPIKHDPNLDNIPPLQDGKFPVALRRVTIDEGIEKFLAYFPKGFHDERYHRDERDYKWAARERFHKALPATRFEELLHAGDVAEIRQHVLATAAKVNLLSVYEASAFRDALRDDAAALEYFRALRSVIAAPQADEATFTSLMQAVNRLPADEGKSSPAKWTILTLLPFLSRPDVHMFLKPEVTKACAERIPFHLNYRTTLNWLTYSRLLAMSEMLRERLAPLQPRDFIDVQSFIWVMGAYT